MLTASFACFRGLSAAAERKLWEAGCLDWRMFQNLPPNLLSPRKADAVKEEIRRARNALQAGMPDFFLNRLPTPDKARVLYEFHPRTAFVDIETTGLRASDRVTAIALLKNGRLSVFVKNCDLHAFLAELHDVQLLATYNGTRFDLPFIRKEFGIDLGIPHLDLMPVLAAYGYRGGQKQCERLAGFKRRVSEGIDGAEAVEVWRRFERDNDPQALHDLALYNAEDVVMLEKLACLAYNRSMQAFPVKTDIHPGCPSDWTLANRTSAL